MILRKRSSIASKSPHNPLKVIPKTTSNFPSLIFFTCLVSLCSGAYDPYRPHSSYPPPWSPWDTPGLLNHTSAITTSESYKTSTDMPVEDDGVITFPEDPDDSWSGDKSSEQGVLTQTSTTAPIVTVVTMPDDEPTETAEQTEAPRRPEDHLSEMLESLDKLLSNGSAVVTVADVADTFDQLDMLLDADLEFPGSMLRSLEALGARAALAGPRAVLARRNVAVVLADSAPAQPVRALRVAAGGQTAGDFEILADAVESSALSDASDAVVNLPPSLSRLSRRVSFVVFGSDRAFVTRHGDQSHVNSRVIGVAVDNFTMDEGEVIDIHFKPLIHKPARNLTRACAYWHFADNGTGYWSQEGCIFIPSATGLLATCRCSHLTHFAEVLVPKSVFSESDESALQIISLTGCFLSLFGLLIIGLTAILFRAWRSDFNNKIWIQLTLALFINVVCFLVIVFTKFEDYNLFCFFVGILLHYAVLATFCWMLVAAIISYRKLVLIFVRDPPRKLLKASAFSWFLPLTVIMVLVAVAPDSYVRRFEQKTPNGAFCFPSGLGLGLTVYVPMAITVLTNWVLFTLILRSVFATKKIKKHGDSSDTLRRASVSCLLVFLFGLPWVFGLFAYNIVAAYLFTLTTSYQGFVLFIFFVIINTKTRGMWLTRLRMKKKTKAPVSSSLLTNKSEPVRGEDEQAFIEPSSTRTNVTSLKSDSSDEKAMAYNVSKDSVVIQDSNPYRDDSDVSFKTANSFANIYENETDDNSIPRIVGAIEKIQTKPATNGNDILPTKKFVTVPLSTFVTSTKSLPNDLEGDERTVSLEPNYFMIQELTNNTCFVEERENNSTQNQGNDSECIPDLTLYNVPTQSASLVS